MGPLALPVLGQVFFHEARYSSISRPLDESGCPRHGGLPWSPRQSNVSKPHFRRFLGFSWQWTRRVPWISRLLMSSLSAFREFVVFGNPLYLRSVSVWSFSLAGCRIWRLLHCLFSRSFGILPSAFDPAVLESGLVCFHPRLKPNELINY